jgi:hypothetical protein
MLTVFAGKGPTEGFAGDGEPALAALLSCPVGLIIDGGCSLYVADHGNKKGGISGHLGH